MCLRYRISLNAHHEFIGHVERKRGRITPSP